LKRQLLQAFKAMEWQIQSVSKIPMRLERDGINLDGVVNGLDISAVASHWLETGQAAINGDANGDGVVNGLDIALIASHWLQTGAGGGGTGMAVPEPSAIMLATIGALALLASARAFRGALGCPRNCGEKLLPANSLRVL
jgi:hypothetical protein